MEALSFKGVSFTYPESEYCALSDVSFSLEKGSFSLVMGASAAGKSTLLSLLKKEIAPHGSLVGEVKTDGFVGYLCQNAEESIVCDRVRGELAFGVQNLGKTRKETELLVAEAAAYFNLESKLDCEISALSGGEKQLVCLASVMIMKPDILVLDEPCATLDPFAADRLVSVIKKLHSDLGITVIMSEHSTDLLYSYADNILLLEGGRLSHLGSPASTLKYLENAGNPLVSAVPAPFRLKNKTLGFRELTAQNATAPALTAKGLCFAYNRGENVLNALDYSACGGKFNAVIGCNGCGKTTLLKVLAGVYKPYRGKVKADGRVAMLTQNVKDVFTKEKCAEEVTFGELTDYLGISDIANRHPYDLSGGQAQRLALAKVLERGADIILLDEPTRGLDVLLKAKLGELLKRLCSEGKMVIIVSHDLDFVGQWADFAAFMSEGAITACGAAKPLLSSLSLYTTSISRLTRGKAVSAGDLLYD